MIVAHMVVGPGEYERFLEPVLERTSDVADVIHVALDPEATENDWRMATDWADVVTWTEPPGFREHEGRYRTNAWRDMEESFAPTEEDMILCIDADEIIVSPDVVRKAAKEYPQMRLGFTFYHMWGEMQYRVDGQWKPHNAWIMFPYRKGATHADKALACGREPAYAQNLQRHGVPVSDMLHYGYARDEDKVVKYNRYMELDGGQFHSNSHILSIIQNPSLEAWEKGGLIAGTF